MSKKKVLGFGLILLVTFAISLYIFTSIYFTSERLKKIIIPRIETVIGRKVKIQEIKLRLFKGIEITKFVVQERSGSPAQKFVSCDKLILKYHFWPLLMRRIEIGSLILEKPYINVLKDQKGEFNFSDILKKFQSQRATSSKKHPKAPSKTETLALLISQIKIEDGEVYYKDLKSSQGLELTQFYLNAKNLTLNRPCPVKASFLLNQFQVNTSGNIDLSTLTGDINLEVTGENFVAFKDFFPQTLKSLRGQLFLSLHLKGSIKKALFDGEIKGKNIEIELNSGHKIYDLSPQLSLKGNFASDYKTKANLGGELDFSPLNFKIDERGFFLPSFHLSNEISYNFITQTIRIKKALVWFPPNNRIIFSGLFSQTKLEGNISSPSLKLSDLSSYFPLVQNTKLGGKLSLNLKIKGNPHLVSSLNVNGALRLNNLSLTWHQKNLLSEGRAEITFQKTSLIISKLHFKSQDACFDIDGKIGNLFSKPEINLNLTGKNIDVNKLMTLLPKSSPQPSSNIGPNNSKSIPHSSSHLQIGPIHFPFKAYGKISLANLYWKKLGFKAFSAQYQLEKDILILDPISATLLQGGNLNGKARIDFTRPNLGYQTSLNLSKANLEQFAALFLKKNLGKIKGSGNLNLNLSGQGVSLDEWENSLNAKGKLSAENIQFQGNPVIRNIASFLDIAEIANPKFDNLKGDFEIKQGKVVVNTKANQKHYGFSLKGNVSLKGSLHLKGRVKLASSLVQRSRAKKIFKIVPKDKQSNYLVPLLIKGSVKSPQVSLDSKVIKEILQRKGKQKIKELLEKKLRLPINF